MRKLNRAKRAKSLEPDMFYVPRGELVLQLKDSLGNLLEERREKITISSIVAWEKLTADFVAKEEGEVTVFIDNSDTEPVYFDNLELRIESDPTLVITQEHHYYPFGMNLSGIERQGDLMYQFNGMVEKEQAFGLELYETPFRSYDAQLGRFWQVEPLADIYCGISMYQFGYNNPVSFNDPTGLSSDTGDGKEEKEDIGIIPVGNPLDITPIDGRVIGDYSPRGSSGSKIGGGGYTWDLGNTRGSPYSMGGRPGQGPAMLRIVNYEGNKDVKKAISIVNTFLRDNGVNARAVEVSKGESASLTAAHTQGRNAVYLIGDSKNKDALLKYSDKLNLPWGGNQFTDTRRESVESANGYNYTYSTSTKKYNAQTVNPYQGGNGAVIGLDKFYEGKNIHGNITDGFVGIN